jgi:choline monooxygenase
MNLFSADHYVTTRRPLSEASPLPPDCYTSPDWYRREIETIFLKEWLLVGRTDELSKAGDYLVHELAGEAVLLLRGEDQELRAFSPFCRHRGTRLMPETGSGNCRVIVCPYHAWTYNLNGTLRGAPGMEGVKHFERGDFSLRPIRLETWEGFIFVNFDDSAPHLLPWLGDLPGKLAKYRLSELVVTRRKSYTIPCNWKFYVDNTVEPYHVPAVHGGTIQNVGPRNAWRFEANDGSYIILYGLFPGSLSLLHGDTGFPPIQGMSLDREERHDLPFLLPNTHLLCTTDTVWWVTIVPLTPETCRVDVVSTFQKSVIGRPDFETLAGKYYKRLDVTNVEDNGIVDLQQRGTHLRKYIPGRYSLWERNPHLFANYVLDRVVGGDYFRRYSQSIE